MGLYGHEFDAAFTPQEVEELENIAREMSQASTYSLAWCVHAVKHMVLAGYDLKAIREAVPTLLTCWGAKCIVGGIV